MNAAIRQYHFLPTLADSAVGLAVKAAASLLPVWMLAEILPHSTVHGHAAALINICGFAFAIVLPVSLARHAKVSTIDRIATVALGWFLILLTYVLVITISYLIVYT